LNLLWIFQEAISVIILTLLMVSSTIILALKYLRPIKMKLQISRKLTLILLRIQFLILPSKLIESLMQKVFVKDQLIWRLDSNIPWVLSLVKVRALAAMLGDSQPLLLSICMNSNNHPLNFTHIKILPFWELVLQQD
jgi:hypothetical protein